MRQPLKLPPDTPYPGQPELYNVRRVLGDIKKFPHKLAAEYPEEWLCRILEGLEMHLKHRGVYSPNGTARKSAGPEADDKQLAYTIHYTMMYLGVARVALKQVLDERIWFFLNNAVPSGAEMQDEIDSLKVEIDSLNALVKKLRAENAMLARLVRLKNPATALADSLQPVVAAGHQAASAVAFPSQEADRLASQGDPSQAGLPSRQGLIARSDGRQVRNRLAREEALPAKKVSDYLAEILDAETGSSGTSDLRLLASQVPPETGD